MSAVSTFKATRKNGCCRGSLWKQQLHRATKRQVSKSDETKRSFEFCVVVGVLFTSYTDYNAYCRGDHPMNVMKIVGASASFGSSNGLLSETSSPQTTFRMVTSEGTHLYCTAPSNDDCSIWLATLHAGLEVTYSSSVPEFVIMKPPSPPKTSKSRGMFRDKRIACKSCGRFCEIITLATPLPQYGYERRCHVCPECLVSQGVWLSMQLRNQLYATFQYERQAFQKARDECYKVTQSGSIAEDNPNNVFTPTVSAANALRDLISRPEFLAYRRVCPNLDRWCSGLELGQLDVMEFIELLDDNPDTEIVELKKEAFRVAGDMGSAMKLLADYSSGDSADDMQMFKHTLEFFLDLCDEGDISSVSFFWPQLQSLHLQMLPPQDHNELLRVELMEDFLLTIAVKYSVQMALDITWSYVADLEDSLFHVNISPPTRSRRFSVLRFVCELESLLFDFQDGWGGGSISLRYMLTPSKHQVTLLRDEMLQLSKNRKDSPNTFLSRSIRMEKLSQAKFTKPPEEAAQEALRSAKYADYFSSNLSFTRRICDVAEKLRFLDVDERAPELQKEMSSLNASGSMGGDPLNQTRVDGLMRVLRVPSTEGHVFRSKERTPILLLMETIEEELEVNTFKEKNIDERLREQSKRKIQKNGPSEKEANNRRAASHYAVDLELPEFSDAVSSQEVTSINEDANNVNSMREIHEIDIPDPDESTTTLFTDENANHQCPRALTKFKRYDSPQNSFEDAKNHSETPSKKAMEQLVTDVMSQTLKIPGALMDQSISTNLDNDNGNNSQNRRPSASGKTPTNRKMKALGDFDQPSSHASADIKRNVLKAIMSKTMRGSNAIAAGAAVTAQKSLQELDRKRAVEMLMNGESVINGSDNARVQTDRKGEESSESQRQKLINLCVIESVDDSKPHLTKEEEEAMESLRLLLIQRKKAREKNGSEDGPLSQSFSSLRNTNEIIRMDGTIDRSEIIEIDAGDVDPRLAGCGILPPAVLSALTLWKGGVVTTGELLELVKKDLQFTRQANSLSGEADEDNSEFWGRFAFGERWAEKRARIAASSPEASKNGWDLIGVIVKSNDDLRQEAFVMQLIELCREAFEVAGLELWLHPYKIVATGRTTGIIECVKNAMSFDALKKRKGYKDGLRGHLKRMSEFSSNPGGAFKTMQHNFVRSLAAYSLLSYVFLFKDRHNGNILLDTAGHVIHIDFGFVFGIAPGGSFSLEMSTPFKITDEMLGVMGGLHSPFFGEFVTLFCCGFLALRTHLDTFLTIVEITCKTSSFKCFEGREASEVVEKLRTRFCPELSKESAVAFALDLIKQSTQSFGTKQYDYFQYLSQGIAA